jgi:hypothetical protein
MITGSTSGKDISGTPSEEITVKCRKTGTTGKKISIGKETTIGAFRKHSMIRKIGGNSNKRIEENLIEMIETIGMIETTETTSTTSTTRRINTASTRIDSCGTKAVRAFPFRNSPSHHLLPSSILI